VTEARNYGTTFSRISQTKVWNPDFAFAYPSLATNLIGEVGIALGFGGGSSAASPTSGFEASSAVGMLGDFMVYYPALSDTSLTKLR
jgi:hypothetical protein